MIKNMDTISHTGKLRWFLTALLKHFVQCVLNKMKYANLWSKVFLFFLTPFADIILS